MRLATGTALGAATLGGLAVFNNVRAYQEERALPPIGHFLAADGARVHYVEKGEGRPLVLVHGAGSMIQDFATSILDRAAERYRVIAIDRPGYGYSTRPKDRNWSPLHQAHLLRHALNRLGVERPVVLGHSWGSLVALAHGLAFPRETAGVLLVGGYYFPTTRPEIPVVAAPSAPVLGPIYRNTIGPIAARISAERAIAKIFAPNPVPAAFRAGFPVEFCVRPGQLRALGEDAALLRPSARHMMPDYGRLAIPAFIMAGASDQIVDPHRHSLALHHMIPHSALRIIPETGHMVHHIRPTEVLDAVEVLWQQADAGS